MGTVRILHRAGTISLQAAVHPKYTLGALNMKEEERRTTWTGELKWGQRPNKFLNVSLAVLRPLRNVSLAIRDPEARSVIHQQGLKKTTVVIPRDKRKLKAPFYSVSLRLYLLFNSCSVVNLNRKS